MERKHLLIPVVDQGWLSVSPCPGASLLEQQVELKAVDTALISKELLIQLPSSGGLGIPACSFLGFKIK